MTTLQAEQLLTLCLAAALIYIAVRQIARHREKVYWPGIRNLIIGLLFLAAVGAKFAGVHVSGEVQYIVLIATLANMIIEAASAIRAGVAAINGH
jgi:cytochrome c oxidase assembly factor CtaG